MQTQKKTSNKSKKEKPIEVETTKKLPDDKLKKSTSNVSTPRPYLQKTTTADIYSQKNKTAQSVKAPRKSLNTTKTKNESPMKDYLKSTSTTSVVSKSSKRSEASISTKPTPRRAKDPFVNVTVNSPVTRKKLNLDQPKTIDKLKLQREISSVAKSRETKPVKSDSGLNLERANVARSIKDEVNSGNGRQRTKTRTLDENEVKILTAEAVDNNEEMRNLTRKLTAQPKAFYVDLDEGESKRQIDKSEDEVSYEDDFESYESDFESYHSESPGSDEQNDDDDGSDPQANVLPNVKEIRDEENMLDSGSYDLRDRSAKSKPSAMEFITEDCEDRSEKKVSLTDEGFQEMSSSAVSSLRTINEDDRPNFIDFSKSKEQKRKRLVAERLKQRAKDLLSMITLHEVSYFLYEMKPISYDKYMATFGRGDHTQTSTQTFDDGVHQETQTEEVFLEHKWTQNPVDFTNNEIFVYKNKFARKYSEKTVDYFNRFSFLTQISEVDSINNMIDTDYRNNQLRVYLEQKDGVGPCEMLPYENYKNKLSQKSFDSNKLVKFLNKSERKLSRVLSKNVGKTEVEDINRNTKIPFSKGFTTLTTNFEDENLNFLRDSKINKIIFSNTDSLIITVHSLENLGNTQILCVWDISVARLPIKTLISIDGIILGRFKGNTDGIFLAALDDGSVHLWDLSEQPTLRDDVANHGKATNLVENNLGKTIDEQDQRTQCVFQTCAYTTSAFNMTCDSIVDKIVGLEITSRETQQASRKIIGQVIILQRSAKLSVWSIVQDKKTTTDIGKAYNSKIHLENVQIIDLLNHIDITSNNTFDLAVAKKRLSLKKQERIVHSKFKSDRSMSAITKTYKGLPSEKFSTIWEKNTICCDLKILSIDGVDNYLVAKNHGEVLCCRKSIGGLKVRRFCVTNDTSPITSIQVTSHLPYFLAATESGTVNVCSLLENRVLLTLDCSNIAPSKHITEKFQSDHKGRYIGTVTVNTATTDKLSVTSLSWPPLNPCQIFALLKDGTVVAWDLTVSDINGRSSTEKYKDVVGGDNSLALVTSEGKVQLHRLDDERSREQCLMIFVKYVALL